MWQGRFQEHRDLEKYWIRTTKKRCLKIDSAKSDDCAVPEPDAKRVMSIQDQLCPQTKCESCALFHMTNHRRAPNVEAYLLKHAGNISAELDDAKKHLKSMDKQCNLLQKQKSSLEDKSASLFQEGGKAMLNIWTDQLSIHLASQGIYSGMSTGVFDNFRMGMSRMFDETQQRFKAMPIPGFPGMDNLVSLNSC